MGVANSGLLDTFCNSVVLDGALIACGGAYAISKIASRYKEYSQTRNSIKNKDLYFYYALNQY